MSARPRHSKESKRLRLCVVTEPGLSQDEFGKPPTCDNENYSLSRCVDLQKQLPPADIMFHMSVMHSSGHLRAPLWHMTHAHDTCILPSHTAKERSVDCKSYRGNHKHRSVSGLSLSFSADNLSFPKQSFGFLLSHSLLGNIITALKTCVVP